MERLQTNRDNLQHLKYLAEQIMRRSNDPLHDKGHIDRMLIMYSKFKGANPKVKHDEDAVELAILWHDTFKALTDPTKKTLLREITEGVESARIFTEFAKKYPTSKETTKNAAYAIRKHSIANLLPRSTPEAKILFDLDELDVWNPDRLDNGIFQFNMPESVATISLLHYLQHRRRTGFYFKWSLDIFNERADEIVKALNRRG